MACLFRYLGGLTSGRTILWCYAIWYGVNVVGHFEARWGLWLTSVGLSAVIGTALVISTRASSRGPLTLDGWQVLRLYLMPFCVSSFSALVKDAGYVLVFPPSWRENLVGAGAVVLFLAVVATIKARGGASPP